MTSTIAPPFAPATLPPILKWAGGKRWIVPQLKQIWDEHCNTKPVEPRLVELFCGGLSVALGLQPKRALLSDTNRHLINLYKQVKKGLQACYGFNEADFYYAMRSQFNQRIAAGYSETEYNAQLFYYLNRTGFNGLCRFSNKELYNVPFGRYKTINYIQSFEPYKDQFANWDFQCSDFQSVELHNGDFVYADPPYDDGFTTYSPGGFSWDDQKRLCAFLSKCQGPVIASNKAADRILALYESHGFSIQLIEAPRRISCKGDRTPVLEMLATRNL